MLNTQKLAYEIRIVSDIGSSHLRKRFFIPITFEVAKLIRPAPIINGIIIPKVDHVVCSSQLPQFGPNSPAAISFSRMSNSASIKIQITCQIRPNTSAFLRVFGLLCILLGDNFIYFVF